MNRLIKGLAALLAACFVVMFAGCMRRDDNPVKIALIGTEATPTGVGAERWEAICDFAAQNGMQCGYYPIAEDSFEGRATAIRKAMNRHAQIVFFTDDTFGENVFEAQYLYEGYYFVLIDDLPRRLNHWWSNATSNVTCAEWNDGQEGALAGYAAVAEGYRKLGIYGGDSAYKLGFLYGAQRASEELGVPVEAYWHRSNLDWVYASGAEVLLFEDAEAWPAVLEGARTFGAKLICKGEPIAEAADVMLTWTWRDERAVTEEILTLWNWGYFGLSEWDPESLARKTVYLGAGYSYLGVRPARDFIGIRFEGLQHYTEAMQRSVIEKFADGTWDWRPAWEEENSTIAVTQY